MLNGSGDDTFLSDAELVGICNAGDTREARRAFASIFRRHLEAVVHVARRYAPDPDSAHDVTQGTFLALLEHLPPNGPGVAIRSSLGAYLCIIARNAGISARRRASSLVAGGIVSNDFVVAKIVEPTDFGRILAGLPNAQQVVILLRFVGAFRFQEIAEMLGIPLGTVKSRLHNGIRQIRSSRAINDLIELGYKI